LRAVDAEWLLRGNIFMTTVENPGRFIQQNSNGPANLPADVVDGFSG
jgi:hypothetical protein